MRKQNKEDEKKELIRAKFAHSREPSNVAQNIRVFMCVFF